MRPLPAVALAAISLALAACRPYAGFTLPKPEGTRRDLRPRLEAASEPVLGRGPAGSFDSVDALNPSLVRRGGVVQLYSGYDGNIWRTDWRLH
jgi:hypothetical protein